MLGATGVAAIAADTPPSARANAAATAERFYQAQQSMWPFLPPSREELAASPRKVYAHRHLFPVSYDNEAPTSDKYHQLMQPAGPQSSAVGGFVRQRPLARGVRSGKDWRVQDARWDMQLAQAMGVDGFWFNLALVDRKNADYWPGFIEHLTAAEQMRSGFTLAPNFDFAGGEKVGGAELADDLVDFLTRNGKLNSPVLQRIDGHLVVTSFGGTRASPAWWQAFRDRMTKRGQTPFLVICSLPWKADVVGQYGPVASALADWGIRNSANYDYDTADHFGGIPPDKLAVAMIRGFDVRYKRGSGSYWESHGSKTLREHWMAAINSRRANWAQLITWNDHGEDTTFRPNNAKQFAVYDLSAYYLAWFKTGVQPKIAKDALYYFHRVQPANFTPPGALKKAHLRPDSPPVVDEIELVALLTAPGTLVIETSAGTFTHEAPAGLSTFTAPLPASGRPVFRLLREGARVIEFASAFAVGSTVDQDDMTYRSGGSLRALYGQTHPAAQEAARNPAAAELALGEPVWLAK